MKPPADDIEARAPVWEAMSGLYLDTDTTLWHPAAAQAFAASPYSVAELRDILVYEVNPVLWSNLFCVAGICKASTRTSCAMKSCAGRRIHAGAAVCCHSRCCATTGARSCRWSTRCAQHNPPSSHHRTNPLSTCTSKPRATGPISS